MGDIFWFTCKNGTQIGHFYGFFGHVSKNSDLSFFLTNVNNVTNDSVIMWVSMEKSNMQPDFIFQNKMSKILKMLKENPKNIEKSIKKMADLDGFFCMLIRKCPLYLIQFVVTTMRLYMHSYITVGQFWKQQIGPYLIVGHVGGQISVYFTVFKGIVSDVKIWKIPHCTLFAVISWKN